MNLLPEIESLLRDPDLGVRTEAIYLLYLKAGDRGLPFLKELLNHVDPYIQTAAVACMAEHELPEARELLDEDRLETFLVRTDSDAESGRIEVARLLGILPGEHYRVFLAQLMADQSPAVVRAAIASCGRRRDLDFVEPIFERLINYRYRSYAKDALGNYGKSILPLLVQRLHDPAASAALRRHLPGIMWRIRDTESVKALLASVSKAAPAMRFFVVKALNKLHRAVPAMSIDKRRVSELILSECSDFEITRQLLDELPANSTDPAIRLLVRALRERCALSVELVFRMLGLIAPTADIHGAYIGITSSKAPLQAGAAEFLDNSLQGELRRRILILSEQWIELARASQTSVKPAAQLPTIESTLSRILERNDPWLQTLALAAYPSDKPEARNRHASKFASDPDPLLRETAQGFLKARS